MTYRLSAKAEEDIIDIFRAGVEQFGLYQAERYHERLERCFRFLAENPLVAHERFEITPAVRIHPVEAHLVVYRVDGNGDVFIVRVRHGHEDWQAFAGTDPV
ncbi:MAG: type II toxin-antitoxin system RelE/ParE family toxin, partial [Nitrococcus sp.]|nr:type II toxin-antitoxin system RelE/ParE family toxin [Nitrococcus sp.]